MTAAPGAHIALATLPNLRDAGGWVAAGGRRVRTGLLFRSTALDRLDDADAATLAGYGIRCVVDFRTETERVNQPDRALAGVRAMVEDVLADSQVAAPAQMQAFFRDPAQAIAFLASGRADDAMRSAYREFITLPSARAGLGAFYRLLLDGVDVPVLYHCTTGKDRTGWATAALLTLLGVSEDDVYREYLLTNEQLLPALEPLFQRFAAHGAPRELLIPVLGVDRSYLDEAFRVMRAEFGGIEAYFAEGLGIRETEQAALADRLLIDA
ncbi:tyrosine-protein phosphatase [Protaetiibacter intestinalis]|uniref:Tyrosine-protein phosphatase n=1 Tax=Protaetiibacter intestinalis TaxID=2419774 RepID=A0A387B3G8_9MICO|nr:tyrosine-protein phosphatase [Protaetiibacter intestinalis]AYF96963.1 tyrosine-protein phosphatase [Protaetiibacter intestinalis]